jgi:hypothetical protein
MRAPLIVSLVLGLLVSTLNATPTTPPPGSSERQAICDSVRHFLAKQRDPSVEKRLFKIEALRVDGGFAYFEGFFAHADGTPSAVGTADDIVFNMFLKRDGKTWRVIEDLSRTDVPSDDEQKAIRRDFPREIPTSIIPAFWRKILAR